jgi:putative membrane protein
MALSDDSTEDRWFLTGIGIVSLLVLVTVGLLLLGRQGQIRGGDDISALPTLNAFFNGTSAVLLTVGYLCIRRKIVIAHKVCMLTAFGTSCLFLVSYLIYHSQVGSMPFSGQGWIRVVYFPLLVSHIILAAFIVPFALTTIYRAWNAQLVQHRRIARWTLPLWLYVSVTGVMVYWMLYWLYPQPYSPPVAVVQEETQTQEASSSSPAVADGRILETSYLVRFPRYARREADQLVLTLLSWEEMRLQDVRGESYETDRVYSFHGYLDTIGYFLIHVLLWEGDGYLLIDAPSGAQHWLDAPPLISPNGQRFLTASMDVMAGYNPNRVRVYKVMPGRIELEWSLEPGDWGPTEATWLDNQTIRVGRSKLAPSFKLYAAGTMLLKYAEGMWYVVAETNIPPLTDTLDSAEPGGLAVRGRGP